MMPRPGFSQLLVLFVELFDSFVGFFIGFFI
jgi:hypothetical protein